MAYCTHSDVSNFMAIPAFDTNSTPTSTVVTAAIALADTMIDNYLQGRTANADTLKLASCLVVQGMVMRARQFISASEEAALPAPLMTMEVKELLDREMDVTSEIPIKVTNLSAYQTSDSSPRRGEGRQGRHLLGRGCRR